MNGNGILLIIFGLVSGFKDFHVGRVGTVSLGSQHDVGSSLVALLFIVLTSCSCWRGVDILEFDCGLVWFVMALVVVGCMPRPKGSFVADLGCSFELVSRPHGLGLESLRIMVLAETQVGHLARVWLGKPTRNWFILIFCCCGSSCY